MSRKSDSGFVYVFMIFFTIGLLPFAIIYWIIRAIANSSKNNTQSVSQTQENNNIRENKVEDNRIFCDKTEDDIKNEAEIKYDRINDEMRAKCLRDRKNFLKFINISLVCISFVIGIVCVCGGFFAPKNINIFMLILGGIFIAVGGVFFIVTFVQLNKDDKVLILEELRKQLRKSYRKLSVQRVAKYKSNVNQNSLVFKIANELNETYQFNRNICRIHYFSEFLKSKQQLDNFNYDKWICQKLNEDIDFFKSFEREYEYNLNKYKKYSEEYDRINCFRTEIEVQHLKIDYETFAYTEREIYMETKQPAIEMPGVFLEISYTSPRGRNSYVDNHFYSYLNLVDLLKKREYAAQSLEEREMRKRLNELEKAEAKILKKQAARKLKELDKLETKLLKKEEEITKKEEEFILATQGHIYTSDNIVVEDNNNEINENMSLSQKLKVLRNKFDNGEITYEEYQAKRKELM